MLQETAIKVEGLTKEFVLPHKKSNSLKQLFVNLGRKGKVDRRKVLNDISFTINKGEFFGIVGRNGCGKSTLLKLLAGVYTPTNGTIQVNGSLTPFIELGVGFNPELTGRENVYLNGALLGFTHKQMHTMYKDIVDFAELHDFMDQKLKNYSSGMQVRLAFSIAIRAKSDILIIDEVLAVGDAAFQKKCNDYFEKIKNSEKTVVIVTHDMGAVNRFCSRAIYIEDGRIVEIGSPSKVSKKYTLENMAENDKKDTSRPENLGKDVNRLDIKLLSDKIINSSEKLRFMVEYELNRDIKVDLGISIVRQGVSLVEHNTQRLKLGYLANKKYNINYEMELKYFNPGEYQVTVAIFERDKFKLIGYNADTCQFLIDNHGESRGGVFSIRGEWIKRNEI